MNKFELRAACIAAGIKGSSRMTNAQMEAALADADKAGVACGDVIFDRPEPSKGVLDEGFPATQPQRYAGIEPRNDTPGRTRRVDSHLRTPGRLRRWQARHGTI